MVSTISREGHSITRGSQELRGGLVIMSRKLFWLTNQQWSRIEAHLPAGVRGKEGG
jgi:hypothetical protein